MWLLLAIRLVSGQQVIIPIETRDNVILLQTDRDNRLRMVYFGEPLRNESEYGMVMQGFQFSDPNAGTYNGAYTPAGTWSLSEPAIQVVHGDGNPSLDLKYVSHSKEPTGEGGSLTSVVLKDPLYPFTVTLFYKTWEAENVIEQWAEIRHQETEPVLLKKFASANLYFTGEDFYLTTYQGDWAREMQPAEVRLERGIRTVDSKLGTRAMLLQSPNFILALGGPSGEDQGSVILGQLAWSGNFKLEFEVDSYQSICVRIFAGKGPSL